VATCHHHIEPEEEVEEEDLVVHLLDLGGGWEELAEVLGPALLRWLVVGEEGKGHISC